MTDRPLAPESGRYAHYRDGEWIDPSDRDSILEAGPTALWLSIRRDHAKHPCSGSVPDDSAA